MSGLWLKRIDGKTVVHCVVKGSPASSSDIRPDDAIVRIAGKRAEDVSLFVFRNMLCAKENQIQMTVRRGTKDRGVSLVLKDYREAQPKADGRPAATKGSGKSK